MKDRIGCFGGIVYLLMGVIQIFAIIEGVRIWFDLNLLLSLIIAIIISYIPLVGAIAGVIGAVEGWGWSYPWAILLFGWPYALYIILILFAGAKDRMDKRA